MKRTILALALVVTTFGAFAQTTPAAAQKPAVHKTRSHKKAEVKKADTTATPKADKKVNKKKSGK